MNTKLSCLKCGGKRVVSGELKSSKGTPWFMPHEVTTAGKILSMFAGSLLGVPLLTNLAYVCLDCGLLWADVGLTTAEEQIEKWGSDSLKARLRSPDELDRLLDQVEYAQQVRYRLLPGVW